MYEDEVRAFVYDMLKNAEEGEINIAKEKLIVFYRMAKESNLERGESSVVDSGTYNFRAYVEVEESFRVDEHYTISFDVMYDEEFGITAISALIENKDKPNEKIFVQVDN